MTHRKEMTAEVETLELDPNRRRILGALLIAVALCGGLLGLYHWLPSTPVLSSLAGQPALSPLYAFLRPSFGAVGLLFPGCVAVFVWRLPRLLDADATTGRSFALLLAGAAAALPLLLFVVRQPPTELGQLLSFYPGEEIYYDALRITDLADFYRRYVESIPTLSLHGQHFPPGHATWMAAVLRLPGRDLLVVAGATLVVFVLGMLAFHRAFRVLLGEARARQASLLCLAAPSLLDFACTSTDAVFFGSAGLSLWLGLSAFQPGASRGFGVRLVYAAGAGVALFASTLLSYSALPLGLAILLYGVTRITRGDRRAVISLGAMGATFGAACLLLHGLSGFDHVEHFVAARVRNVEFMTVVLGQSPAELYLRLAYGNAAAFVIGSGVAIWSALLFQGWIGAAWREPFPLAVSLTFAVLVLGGFHQMETERIWLYAVPWLAGLSVYQRSLSSRHLRLLAVAGWTQAYLMETLLFTLW